MSELNDHITAATSKMLTTEALARFMRETNSEAVLSIFNAGAAWAASACIDVVSGSRIGGKLTPEQGMILAAACDAIDERFCRS